jgi:hypothetical protein
VELAGVPIRTCPAFTINIDFREFTTLPPGYRTYEFHDNGDVTGECHLLDGGPWKRHKLPKPAAAFSRSAPVATPYKVSITRCST